MFQKAGPKETRLARNCRGLFRVFPVPSCVRYMHIISLKISEPDPAASIYSQLQESDVEPAPLRRGRSVQG